MEMPDSVEARQAFKIAVKKACMAILQQRITNATAAMAQAQESANNQEKSSVGDKHETSRAIGQAESEMNARQLAAARAELGLLEKINVEQQQTTVNAGTVLQINTQLFFVAVGLGLVEINQEPIMVISQGSPLFALLKGKKNNDKVMFQQKEAIISGIF